MSKFKPTQHKLNSTLILNHQQQQHYVRPKYTSVTQRLCPRVLLPSQIISGLGSGLVPTLEATVGLALAWLAVSECTQQLQLHCSIWQWQLLMILLAVILQGLW